MSTITDTEADARAASRERLRAVVIDNLLNAHDHTTDPYTAAEAIMAAAQQWALEGYMISTAPAAPCPKSGGTVSRWYAPHGWAHTAPDDVTDPGPYTEGERVPCPGCKADVPVTPHANTMRETGRQYVARLAEHTIPAA
jgi:hypothetical protein